MAAATRVDTPEDLSDNEYLDQSLSMWRGRTSPNYSLDEFLPIPLDLHTAASIGFSSSVHHIITSQPESLDEANKGGWTPLMYASYIGHDLVVEQLLEAGANVNATNVKGQSPLCLATSCGNNTVADVLIRGGADIDLKDKKGWTSLYHATYSGHLNMIQLLVGCGANINIVELKNGLTPLMEACAAGHTISVQFLLDHGANVNATSSSGTSALAIANANGHTEVVRIINKHLCGLASTKSTLGVSITEGPRAMALLLSQLQQNSDFKSATVNDIMAQLAGTKLTHNTDKLQPSSENHRIADISPSNPGKRASQSPENHPISMEQISPRNPADPAARLFTPDQIVIDTRTPNVMTNHSPSVMTSSIYDSVEPAIDLRTFLTQLGLEKYADVFDDQDVDFPMFLTLTDEELKEVGIKLFGPRRKMVNAISRWNAMRSGHSRSSTPDSMSYQVLSLITPHQLRCLTLFEPPLLCYDIPCSQFLCQLFQYT